MYVKKFSVKKLKIIYVKKYKNSVLKNSVKKYKKYVLKNTKNLC